MNNNLIYGIRDVPKKWYEWLVYPIQQVLAVFVATVLIANICGTPVSSCLFGAFVATTVYQIITKFKSPMFISSCGATVSAVIGALAMPAGYLAVAIGGLSILVLYALVALFVKLRGIDALNKILPVTIVGPITIVIGINLAGFIPTYTMVAGAHSNIGILVALFTMLIVALTSHYFKGVWKTIPFLLGLLGGYILSIILTVSHAAPLIDFSLFKGIKAFGVPEFTFLKWNFSTLTWRTVGQVLLLFVPVGLAAVCEHWADHRTLSNIIGTDLTKEPGLHRTLLGDGTASFLGTVICGLPNTSYGESIATTGFSRVASVWMLTVAAGILGLLSFFVPIQVFINSIPSCVFGGCAMILYGYIAASGLKVLINNKVDLENNKNLIVIAVILTVGVSGIWLFDSAFAGVSLALVLGIILNLILREPKPKAEEPEEKEGTIGILAEDAASTPEEQVEVIAQEAVSAQDDAPAAKNLPPVHQGGDEKFDISLKM